MGTPRTSFSIRRPPSLRKRLASQNPLFSVSSDSAAKDDAEVPRSSRKPKLGATPETLQAQGCALAEQGKFREALKKFDAALALEPTAARLELRSQTLMALDMDFEAILAAEAAAKLAPDWSEVHLTLARARLNLGEVIRASESFSRAARLDPTNDDLRLEMRRCEELRQQIDDAYAHEMERARSAHDPTAAEVVRCKAALRKVSLSQPRAAFVPHGVDREEDPGASA